MNWVCKTEAGSYEILKVNGPRPASAIAEAPLRPNGEPVDRMALLRIRRSYFLPESSTRAVLEDGENPPTFYRDMVTLDWHTPVPSPVPTFWFRDGEWSASETEGATERKAPCQTPSVVPFAEVDDAALAAEEIQRIAAAKLRKRKEVEGAYEQALSTVKAGYSESERAAWPQKEAEAKAWASLSAADKTSALSSMAYPLLVEEALQGDYSGTATARKAKVDGVASRVVANAQAYKQFAGKCTGVLKKAQADIDSVSGSYAEVTTALDALLPQWPRAQ